MVLFSIFISSILEVLVVVCEYLYMLIVFGFTLLGFRFFMGVSFVVKEMWCRMGIMFSCFLSKRYKFV